MTSQRNVIALIIACFLVLIFFIHITLTKKKSDVTLVSSKSVTGNLLEYTKSLVCDDQLKNSSKTDTESTDNSIDTYSIVIKDLKSIVEILKKENKELNKNNKGLLTKETKLKSLVRKLGAKLKSREGGVLPKLDPSLPWIFGITPTYARFTQKAELTRLSQTLQHVPNLHWIIIEDSDNRTDLVTRFLKQSGLIYTHLNVPTPVDALRKPGESYKKHHRGVTQRNLALKWIRKNINIEKTPGVVYFMDDDNTYHLKLFEEMRYAKHLAVWKVAFTGRSRFAGPLCENDKVVGFFTKWAPKRLFPIDMAGFAVNLNVFLNEKPDVIFNATARLGYLESSFIGKLATREQLEPKGNNCSIIRVWHTRTEDPSEEHFEGEKEGEPSDPNIEV